MIIPLLEKVVSLSCYKGYKINTKLNAGRRLIDIKKIFPDESKNYSPNRGTYQPA